MHSATTLYLRLIMNLTCYERFIVYLKKNLKIILNLLIKPIRLNVTDSVSNVQSIVVSSQSNVSLLGTVWSNQSVNLQYVNFV